MEVLYPRCCGLDVHLKSVTACLLVTLGGSPPRKEVRTFSTMPADLLRLSDWLASGGCTHVAMESTGVYWKPIWNVLEGTFTLLLVNAAHVKAVPGRKTDVADAEWLAQLLRHGLLRGSFVPDPPQRELRDLTRLRTVRVRARAAEVNRLLKTLEGAGLKLGAVVSDITGVSARAMLEAILGGRTDPAVLAELARGRPRSKRDELEQALAVIPNAHHRFLIAEHLAMLDELDAVIARLDGLIAERVAPFAAELERLQTIPGGGRVVAEGLLAELGTELSRFPTAKHLASWAGMCPGNHESAGKRRGGRTRKGSKWLRRALVEAASGAARTKRPSRTALAGQYRRLVTRRGRQKAIVAVGHRLLLIVYDVLRHDQSYQEPTPADLDQRRRRRVRDRALDQLRHLGYDVTVTSKPTAP
jgi:transposase